MSSERKRPTEQIHWSAVPDKKPKIEEQSEPEAELPKKAPLPESVEVVISSPAPRGKRETVVTESGEKFTIVKLIAEGTFGKVYHVTDKNKKEWAMKLSKKRNRVVRFYDHEKKMMDMIGSENHKNLMPMCTFGELTTNLDNCSPWMILMPLLGPSVREVMERADDAILGVFHSFPVEDIFTIGKQLLEALEVLDQLGLFHLDLKPENILFNNPNLDVKLEKFNNSTYHTVVNDLHIRLGDYGNTTIVTRGEEQFGKVQTQYYRAPEIFLGLPYIETTDIWSVGCVLAELYTGEILFKGPRSKPNRPADIVQFFMMMDVLDKEPSLDQMAEAEIMQSPQYLRIVANRSWEDQVGPFLLLKENIRIDDTQENVEYLFIVIDYLLNFDAKRRPPAYYAKKYL
ncbi:unnamed protein product [Caenorhabditis sp. 36 PRJEB53466]|nr:unnamed protein product [Caenorhabditis sp. 36 PRJEB53466]